jgi:NADH-quinone oxidoreductase subunit L
MVGNSLYLTIILAPLISSIIVGLFGFAIGKRASHSLAILGVFISTVCSYIVLYKI